MGQDSSHNGSVGNEISGNPREAITLGGAGCPGWRIDDEGAVLPCPRCNPAGAAVGLADAWARALPRHPEHRDHATCAGCCGFVVSRARDAVVASECGVFSDDRAAQHAARDLYAQQWARCPPPGPYTLRDRDDLPGARVIAEHMGFDAVCAYLDRDEEVDITDESDGLPACLVPFGLGGASGCVCPRCAPTPDAPMHYRLAPEEVEEMAQQHQCTPEDIGAREDLDGGAVPCGNAGPATADTNAVTCEDCRRMGFGPAKPRIKGMHPTGKRGKCGGCQQWRHLFLDPYGGLDVCAACWEPLPHTCPGCGEDTSLEDPAFPHPVSGDTVCSACYEPPDDVHLDNGFVAAQLFVPAPGGEAPRGRVVFDDPRVEEDTRYLDTDVSAEDCRKLAAAFTRLGAKLGAAPSWIDRRIEAVLGAPPAWGSPEAVEMQVLLLLEARAEQEQDPRCIRDTYRDYLRRAFPTQPQLPLFQLVGADDEVYTKLAAGLRGFIDALSPKADQKGGAS